MREAMEMFSFTCCLILVIFLSISYAKNDICSNNGNKTALHIRSIMTRQSEAESQELGTVLQAAVNHINNMEGVLDNYYICFKWKHAKVSISLHHI